MCFSFLAAVLLAGDRNHQFRREYDNFIGTMHGELASGNLQMLDLYLWLSLKNQKKASERALEIKEDFQEVYCVKGETIAYYFLY